MTKSQSVERSDNLIATDRELRALKPLAYAADYRDAQLSGLVVRVLPSGALQFSVRYRHQGKQLRLRLGDFPAVTLAEARKRARRAMSAIDDNRDPVAEARAARAPHEDTVEKLTASYLRRHAAQKRSAAEDERIIDVEILPRWRDRSVRALRRRDVRELLETIIDRGSPVMANRVLAVIRTTPNFAVDQDWIEANPAARMGKPTREVSRDRVLDDDEIRRVWRLLSNLPTTADRPAPGRKTARGRDRDADPVCPLSPPLAAWMKMRLLTAQRGGEVARMRWCDVDLEAGWWTIPAADAKNGEQHRVPLTEKAIAIVASQKPEREHRSDASVFIGTGESILDRAKKAPAAVAAALDIEFRGHDLRRTAATRMAAAGISREHIAHVLNHVDRGARATRVYDRHDYDREKRSALETWARELERILKNEAPASNVVPMRA